MSKLVLGLFNIDTLIEFIIDLLAAHIKNPGSAKAMRLRFIVERLHVITTTFLEKVH